MHDFGMVSKAFREFGPQQQLRTMTGLVVADDSTGKEEKLTATHFLVLSYFLCVGLALAMSVAAAEVARGGRRGHQEEVQGRLVAAWQ